MAPKQAQSNQRPHSWRASVPFPCPAALKAAPRADSPSAAVTGGGTVTFTVPCQASEPKSSVFFLFFFPHPSCPETWHVPLAGYIQLCVLECRSRGQICRYAVNRYFNLLKNLSLSWNLSCLRGFASAYLSTVLAFATSLTVKMCSFQGKKLRSRYLLTCSHCWLFEAQLSDLRDKFALWMCSVWCGKSNIWRLIGGTSLSDMLLHITFNINWMFLPLSVCSDPVRTAFSKRTIDKPSNWHG